MEQLKLILKRLKRPGVIISITSQIITVLLLLNVNVNIDVVTGIVTAICSILVLLGILSDPDSEQMGYGDIFALCSGCGKKTHHVFINGQLVCKECGCINCNEADGNRKSSSGKK